MYTERQRYDNDIISPYVATPKALLNVEHTIVSTMSEVVVESTFLNSTHQWSVHLWLSIMLTVLRSSEYRLFVHKMRV
jgi:hypothetical protein